MRFDLSQFHLLLQAFDLTGRRLYGKNWRGDEAFARDTGDPSKVSKERRDIQDRIKALATSAAPHHAMLATDADEQEHQHASDALHHITREQDQLRGHLATLPHITGSWLADHDAFTRRRTVETELFGAFESGDLALQVGPNEIVQWRSWSRQPDFKVLISMSCVILPRCHTGQRRRGPAFIQRAALNKWLSRFALLAENVGELTPEGQLEVWLRDKIRQYEPKELRRDDYRKWAQSEIPDLSNKAFYHVWKQVAPQSWKQKGARSKKRSE